MRGWLTVNVEPVTAPRLARLEQPWRFAVAAGELIVAAAAVIVGILLWGKGVTTMVTPLAAGRPPLVSTIFYGNWMAAGVGLTAVAALLVLDAVREVILAARARTRRTPETTVPPPPD
ncbi:MAG TPA: hypothetical protein VHV49_00860 [Pseudonocardiaceae bacterium]|nr:hypothetical protein [Pseudonocardiaceae bacterium]